MKPKYGIFGGTFDPPHLGHLILASEAMFQLGLDRCLWVLTPDPPHKQGKYLTPVEIRMALLKAALADAPQFEISNVDIDRPGPHYAFEMVCLLKLAFSDVELIYLMGGDSLRDLHNWYKPNQFLEVCDAIGVMRRPGATFNLEEIESKLPGINSKIRFVDAPLLEISSRQIRKRIIRGAPFRYYLHPDVHSLIVDEKIYGG